MTLQEQLKRLGACEEARTWAAGYDTLTEAWDACPRGDWMLWLAARAGVDRRLVVQAACDCAEQALVHVPAGEGRPAQALATARAWAEGRATLAEVQAASHDATDAARAAWAAWAAAYAAYAAADAAAYAAYAAADAAARAAPAQSLRDSADIVRTRIPLAAVEAAPAVLP